MASSKPPSSRSSSAPSSTIQSSSPSSTPFGNPYSFVTPEQEPTDIFYPYQSPAGPVLLDSGGCLCALRSGPGVDAAYRCLGNHTTDIYTGTTGKWFGVVSGGSNSINAPYYDASTPPNIDDARVAQGNSLVPLSGNSGLDVFDNACTGKNNSQFSTSYYRAVVELQTNKQPFDAAPCWEPGAVAKPLMNASTWQEKGCSAGFFCPNNTINSLPEYCPPPSGCVEQRLGGLVCSYNGSNVGSGPFEPVLCDAGYYCGDGSDKIQCPDGNYCMPGAASPTPCSGGSHCPAGSSYELFLIPLAILIVVDVLVLVGTLFTMFRSRLLRNRRHHRNVAPQPTRSIRRQSGYKTINEEVDDDDEESSYEVHAYNTGLQRRPTGFEAAYDWHSRTQNQGQRMKEEDYSSELRHFVESMKKATPGTNLGLSFAFDGLTFSPKKSAKPVLSNLTGSIESGSLCAILGGSGAGKSSFINVLMGKTSHTDGKVMINGAVAKARHFRKLIGFVPQDDIVLPELTVYENILHSARIRMPSSWSQKDIRNHVEAVIECLELSHVRDSLVGSVAKPVISGGQRKRVSIGMELGAAPRALILDEPTSGLDATSAASLTKTLKALSKLGITVVLIIHQPRSEIFELIDDLILLADGQMVYQGPQHCVKNYFEGMDFHFPEHANTADIVCDAITGSGGPYKASGDASKAALIAHWQSVGRNMQRLQKRESMVQDSQDIRKAIKARGAPYYKQIYFCLIRALLQQWRLRASFFFEMALAALGGFLLGLSEASSDGVLFTGLFRDEMEVVSSATNYRDIPELSLLVAIAVGLIASSPGVKVFSEETLLHRREAEAGHSRLAYYLAKTLSTLPRMVMACFHFTVLVMVLSTPIIPWGTAFGLNLLYFFCIYGLAAIVSMVTRREDAPLFAVMLSLIVGILSGASPTLHKVSTWHMSWLWRASPGTWLTEAYWSENTVPLAYLYDIYRASNYTGFTLGNTGVDCAVLFAIGVVYRVIAFAGLVFVGQLKKR